MRKTFLYLIFIFIGGSALQTFADNTEVDLSIDYKGCMDSGHPCGHPSVSYDDDEITIKSDSTIYDVSVVVKDQYGNVMHQSTQTVGSEGTVIYVPDTGGDSEKTTIDLYYDRKHLSGYLARRRRKRCTVYLCKRGRHKGL